MEPYSSHDFFSFSQKLPWYWCSRTTGRSEGKLAPLFWESSATWYCICTAVKLWWWWWCTPQGNVNLSQGFLSGMYSDMVYKYLLLGILWVQAPCWRMQRLPLLPGEIVGIKVHGSSHLHRGLLLPRVPNATIFVWVTTDAVWSRGVAGMHTSHAHTPRRRPMQWGGGIRGHVVGDSD